MTIRRIGLPDDDFARLVELLDEELDIMDKKAHAVCSQYNGIYTIKHIVLMYDDNKPIGCGAIKEYEPDTMEMKRIYMLPEYRRNNMASAILEHLEAWTSELGYSRCVLETGRSFDNTIKFYKKNGYTEIPNYGQYKNIETSICFEKHIESCTK